MPSSAGRTAFLPYYACSTYACSTVIHVVAHKDLQAAQLQCNAVWPQVHSVADDVLCYTPGPLCLAAGLCLFTLYVAEHLLMVQHQLGQLQP